MADTPAPQFAPFRTITCPNCRTELPQYEHRSIYIACHSCGVVSDATAEKPYTVIRQFDPEAVPYPSGKLQLGEQLVVGDEVWLLLGRRHFFWHYSISQNGQAAEEKEMVKDYAHDGAFFEWLAVNRREEQRYVREYADRFTLVYPMKNGHEAVPTEKYVLDFANGSPRLIETRGLLELGYFVGETRYAFEHLAEAWEQVGYSTEAGQYWLKYRQGFDLNAFEAVESLHSLPFSESELQESLARAKAGDLPEFVPAPNVNTERSKGFFRKLFGG